jgi:VanZ family protein
MRISKAFVVNQLPAVLVAIVLFILSSIPYPPPVILNVSYEDLIMHAIAYSAFGFFVARALYYQKSRSRFRENLLLFTFLVGTVYGISDEIHQYFVPGRVSDILDVLADVVGTLIGFALFRLMRKK